VADLLDNLLNPLRSTFEWILSFLGSVNVAPPSCLSCHATAEYKSLSHMLPPSTASNTAAMRWFRNIRATAPFDAGQQSLGYSLQLATGIQRFLAAHPGATVTAPSSGRAARRIATVRRRDP
jgi:hypothetical protein